MEDLEDKRSIHSFRSLRNTQSGGGQTHPLQSFFYQNKNPLKAVQPLNTQSSTSNQSPIQDTAPHNSEPWKYMDEDETTIEDRTSRNGQSKETRI